MDISFWTTLNPTLQFANTKSLFYRKYLYKLQLFIPGYRSHKYYNIRTGNSWLGSYSKLYPNSALSWSRRELESLYKCIDEYDSKIRIEHSYISLYSENLSELENLASKVKKIGCEKALHKLFYPINNKIAEEIAQGKIYVKKINPEYNFKVVINGNTSNEEILNKRVALYNYIHNLGDQVVFSPGFRKNMLRQDRWWSNSTYFYCKEESIIVFLKLMAPELITGIYSLVRD